MHAVLEATAPRTVQTAPLTLQDRCDRCGAQALVRVAIPMGEGRHARRLPLDFCNHHFARHAMVLAAQGAAIIQQVEIQGVKPGVYL